MANDEYEFLKKAILDYWTRENSDSALFLSGRWGTGKTYLIKDAIREWELNKGHEKIRYISLNGISSLESLKTRIILSSIRMPSKLNIVKKMNFYPLIKSGASIFDHIPWVGLALPAFKGIIKPVIEGKCVQGPIVFDDIERGKIEIMELLGFLRNYQDEIKQPMVIVGDEDKIKESGTTPIAYSEIKEKLIGRTLIKHANIEDAIAQFVQCLKLSQEVFLEASAMCVSLFREFRDNKDANGRCYENLRAFRISIMEIGDYLNNIERKYIADKAFLLRFLKIGIALKYAVQVGHLTKENWDVIVNHEQQGQGNTNIEKFLELFDEHPNPLASEYPILNLGTWKSLLFGEVVDWNSVNDFIGQTCEPFKEDDSEPYEKLISFSKMSKDEIEENIQLLNKKIENHEIVEMFEIFRAFSCRVSLLSIREKVYEENIGQQLLQLRNELVQYVNELLEKNLLKIEDKDSYAIGHMFERTPLTRIIEKPAKFFSNILQKFTEQSERGELEEVLRAMELGNAIPFMEKLTEGYNSRVIFKVDGIMNPERVVASFTHLSPKQLYNVSIMFYHRYRFNVSNWEEVLSWSIPEREALGEMMKLLTREIIKVKDSDCYRAYNYIRIREDIEDVVNRIDMLIKDSTSSHH